MSMRAIVLCYDAANYRAKLRRLQRRQYCALVNCMTHETLMPIKRSGRKVALTLWNHHVSHSAKELVVIDAAQQNVSSNSLSASGSRVSQNLWHARKNAISARLAGRDIEILLPCQKHSPSGGDDGHDEQHGQ